MIGVTVPLLKCSLTPRLARLISLFVHRTSPAFPHFLFAYPHITTHEHARCAAYLARPSGTAIVDWYGCMRYASNFWWSSHANFDGTSHILCSRLLLLNAGDSEIAPVRTAIRQEQNVERERKEIGEKTPHAVREAPTSMMVHLSLSHYRIVCKLCSCKERWASTHASCNSETDPYRLSTV